MSRSLGRSVQEIALFPAVYAILYAVFAPMLGSLSDRFGRKAMLVPALLGFAATMLGVASSRTFQGALIGWALAGICAAVIQPNTLAIVNDVVPLDKAPVAMGRVLSGLTVSFVVTPVVSSFLATRAHWRIAYVLLAAVALTSSIAILRLQLPRVPASQTLSPWAGVRAALAIRGVGRRLGMTFLWIGSSAGLAAILSETVRRRFGWSDESAGIFAGFFGLCTVLGNAVIGPFVRWFQSRKRMVLSGMVATAAGSALVGLMPAPSLAVPVIGVAIWTLGYGAGGPVHQSVLGHIAGSSRGMVTALNASAINLGIAAVASLTGSLLDRIGVEGVFGMAVGCMLVAVGLAASISDE
ncbi:MFS transporter [Pendulispora albinea]|uniref:MFS transporter n=2 Tax=Pendulispora albinea TaxID=2741071 RepID=A0ABZ2M3X8_9BACT